MNDNMPKEVYVRADVSMLNKSVVHRNLTNSGDKDGAKFIRVDEHLRILRETIKEVQAENKWFNDNPPPLPKTTPLRVDIEDVIKNIEYRSAINKADLGDIEWYHQGKKVEVPANALEEYRFCGLNNFDFYTFYIAGGQDDENH